MNNKLGIGTMSWNPKDEREKEELFLVFQYCLDRGVNFFDTAEVYNNGKVESLLGEFICKDGRTVRISSKFAPPSNMNPITPKRKNTDSSSPLAVHEALDGTLERLGIDSLELYLMHTPPKYGSIKDYMKEFAKEVYAGRIRHIGVCNFNKEQIIEAIQALKEEDLKLDYVMVGYNILRRYPETNGIFDLCEENDITLIPYAPLAEGTLSGKYRNKRVPLKYYITSYFGHLNITKERNDHVSLIKRIFSKPRECDTKRMEPVLNQMDLVASAHHKTLAQVAINWLISTPDIQVFPIPGVRNLRQAKDNIEACNWNMSYDEYLKICEASDYNKWFNTK